MRKAPKGPFPCGDCLNEYPTRAALVAHAVSAHQGDPSPRDIVHNQHKPTGDLQKTVDQDDRK